MLLVLFALLGATNMSAHSSTNSASTNRVLVIDQSSCPVTGGKATLSVGPLKRTAEVYAGDYQVKVSPYFFKGEKGTLAIVVLDESFARVAQGLAAEISGTATSGKDGEVRRIEAVATPLDKRRGALKLWFTVDERKLVFNTTYRILEN